MSVSPPLPSVSEIHRRLGLIFPEQVDPQGWVRRELAARAVFVMLYGYAIEGYERWIRPTAVTDMTDAQAALQEPATRSAWLNLVQSPDRPRELPGRWYGENTREPIRDETLRAFVKLGAVIERPGLPTTSSKPRYALAKSFADLFAPHLEGETLSSAIESWQQKHLSAAALARLALMRKGAVATSEGVLVRLPNGEVRRLGPGPSALLTKAVIEEFAPRFLHRPAVVLLSESARKMTYSDESIAKAIGFNLDVSGALPDVILVDVESDPPLIVFVECVVSDGIVDERRHAELEALALQAGYRPADCAYVTVFRDRAQSIFQRKSASLVWGSFAWFETEPDHIILLRAGTEERATSLSRLLRT
jgi:hypothetical protein